MPFKRMFRPEKGDGGQTHGDRQVLRPGVVAEKDIAMGQHRREISERGADLAKAMRERREARAT